VEDENHWTDKNGNVLPDAILMRKGATALDLAYKVHTDLGERFIRAINGRTKRTLGRDYILENGDVIKIVASR
ncbi:MAG: TGS domain-containing protein, partial [Thermoplasmatales archaeon]